MFCPNCGTNVADGAAFCPSCGTAFSAPQDPVTPQAPVAPSDYYAAPPVAPQPPKKGKGKVVAIILVVFLVVGGIIGALFATGVIGKSDEEKIQEIAEETAKKIERGTISGNTYTNDSIGLTFEKPSDWNYSSDEEMAALVGNAIDDMDRDDVSKDLAKASMVYDMIATSESGDSVQVYFLNLQDENGDIDEALDGAKEGLNSSIKSSLGVDMTFSDNVDTSLGGVTFKAFTGTADYGYGTYVIKMFIHVDKDNKIATMIGITTTGFGLDLEEIEAMFS